MNNRKCLLRAPALRVVNEYLESVWPRARRLFTEYVYADGPWSSRNKPRSPPATTAEAVGNVRLDTYPEETAAGYCNDVGYVAGNVRKVSLIFIGELQINFRDRRDVRDNR